MATLRESIWADDSFTQDAAPKTGELKANAPKLGTPKHDAPKQDIAKKDVAKSRPSESDASVKKDLNKQMLEALEEIANESFNREPVKQASEKQSAQKSDTVQHQAKKEDNAVTTEVNVAVDVPVKKKVLPPHLARKVQGSDAVAKNAPTRSIEENPAPAPVPDDVDIATIKDPVKKVLPPHLSKKVQANDAAAKHAQTRAIKENTAPAAIPGGVNIAAGPSAGIARAGVAPGAVATRSEASQLGSAPPVRQDAVQEAVATPRPATKPGFNEEGLPLLFRPTATQEARNIADEMTKATSKQRPGRGGNARAPAPPHTVRKPAAAVIPAPSPSTKAKKAVLAAQSSAVSSGSGSKRQVEGLTGQEEALQKNLSKALDKVERLRRELRALQGGKGA